jgi:hypothetical protein
MSVRPRSYGIAADHDRLPVLTVSQNWIDEAEVELFGPPDEIRIVSLAAIADSNWSRLFDQFYKERIVHVRSNNVLRLRFAYLYEVDLDQIKTERDLLAWALHLCGKTWMTTERLHKFIEAVARIKRFNVYGGL